MKTPEDPSIAVPSTIAYIAEASEIANKVLRSHDNVVGPILAQVQQAQPGWLIAPIKPRVIQEDNASELRRQIDKLDSQIEELRARKSDKIELRQELEAMQASVVAVRQAEQQLTAPVHLPASEDMAIRLVSAGALDSLQEHQSDYNVYLALAGIFAGLAGGLALASLVNPTTSLSPAYGPVLACLAIVTVIFGVRAWIMNDRIRSTKRRMLGSQPPVRNAPAPQAAEQSTA